ncbi:hypothetical protein NEOLEDRAFT_1184443 [Neolentinus lepideus HHB14362 ss-1]|uniref:Uncharacterized protein n=1 Tax=Neolentinus lepideus HHB14362 ss-1 TaxID=1314782 RepID=A0A165MES6_9AGAM|nr:hypothetical protein NEOLEDRAFT_1184443 [Neolentinus lepideus HHB14362 ss-1]
MASRLATKTLARFASASRTRPSAVARRTMASAHAPAHTSDTPWIAASALIFGSAAIYLLAPPGEKKAHAHGKEQVAHHEQPKTVPAFSDKSPAPDTPTPTTDDEGTEVPESEVKESMDQAYASNSPVDAGKEEAGGDSAEAPSKDPADAESGAPANDDTQKRTDNFQGPEEEGPTPVEKPRSAAAQGVAPREVSKD